PGTTTSRSSSGSSKHERTQMSVTSHVDLAFPARGRTVPRDHGYALYGALSRLIPSIHGADWIAIHGISGSPQNAEVLTLASTSALRVRAPAAKIAELLVLTGATLELAGQQ